MSLGRGWAQSNDGATYANSSNRPSDPRLSCRNGTMRLMIPAVKKLTKTAKDMPASGIFFSSCCLVNPGCLRTSVNGRENLGGVCIRDHTKP